MITTETEAREFLRGLFDSYNTRDWDRFFDRYVWEDCLFFNGNGMHSGKDKMIQFWETAYNTNIVRETLMEPTNIFIKENEIAALLPLKFHFNKDQVYAGVQFKKGDEVMLKCADFYKFRNGKIYEFTVYRFSLWWLKDWAENWEEFEKIVRRV